MAEKRNIKIGMGTFDLATGFAVLLVIAGHMRTRYTFESFPLMTPMYLLLFLLGGGLMPMFFIISGMGVKQKPAGKLLKKTFSELVIPYLWAVPIFSVLLFMTHYPILSVRGLLNRVVLRSGGLLLGLPDEKVLFGHELMPNGVLWFFLTLFLAQNVLNQIIRLKKTWQQILVAAACVAAGFALRAVDFIYFCIPQGLMAVGFCYTGYAIKKWKLLEKWMYSPWTYVLLAPVYIAQFFGNGFNMASGVYTPFDYVAAWGSGILFLFAAVWCSRLEWRPLDYIRKLGMHSFWIIYAHGIDLISFPWYEIYAESPSLLLTFVLEVGLKVMIFMMGIMIFKKISQMKYRKRTALRGKGKAQSKDREAAAAAPV